MTYQVLARKWRPKDFASLVGQDHVVRALTHALDSQRLHHAYLFTGTRGIGKTTLSRILAKALNCETGVTSTPCGVCNACRAIDEGRFVDYVEMDAASNRGVEEMASLLERAIYAPVDARFKVYMIDEVHMLTNHAFNAMLKTLEEPPAHVKFILATTDPQKIPVTVLSRCLQFNLKQMPATHIVGHLENILSAEQIGYDAQALRLLAKAADGSMRDALSLTDQAIAYSAGIVGEEAVRGMLGALDQSYLVRLLDAVAQGDGTAVLAIADEMASRSLSFSTALADLAGLLHRIAWAQAAPASVLDEWPEAADIRRFAEALSAEQVQLLYQIATIGRAELGLAPDEYAGFSMALLRMLAFRPLSDRIGAMPSPGGGTSSVPPAGMPGRGAAGGGRPAPVMSGAPAGGANGRPVGEMSGAASARAPEAVPRSAPVTHAAPTSPLPTTSAVISAPASTASSSASQDASATQAMRQHAVEGTTTDTPEAAPSPAPEISVVQERSAAPMSSASASASALAPEPVAQTSAEPADDKPMSPARAALEAMRLAGLRVPTDKSRASAQPVARRPASTTPSAPLTVPTPRRPAAPEGAAASNAASPNTPAVLNAPNGAVSTPARAQSPAHAAEPQASRASSSAAPSSRSQGADTPPWEAIPDAAYEGGFDASGGYDAPFDDGYDDLSAAPVEESVAPRADVRASRGSASGVRGVEAAPATEVVPKEPPVRLDAFGHDVDWPAFVTRLALRGFARELAFRSELVAIRGTTLELRVAVPQLGDRAHVDKLKVELDSHLGRAVDLSIVSGPVHYTAAAIDDANRARRQVEAERAIEHDPFVQSLIRDFGASIVPGSIRPVQGGAGAASAG
ncbi:DNA polymerase III subunit gamma/tau [Pararobbsia alpina]|uniref:DNA polymerase III subunit gamma/tau n=1 Tax=Pararobbsia alpina TaxID=621374 RepID=UPI0039A41071